MLKTSRVGITIAAAGLVLFFSVGIRQGFGLFLMPVVESGTLSRANFSLAVALQYLIWGCIGPLAAKLARRYGSAIVLATGGGLYALGFWGASLSTGTLQFIIFTGVLIGAGLGLANYGVVNGLVSMSVDPARRGRALGIVGSLTALGQLVLLLFTHWTLERSGNWRLAFEMHAILVAVIMPLAYLLWRMAPQANAATSSTVHNSPAFGSLRDLVLVCVGFAFSGMQVMFTMTHLPALLSLQGSSVASGTWMLVILSSSSFIGSYLMGRLSETFDKRRLLAGVYVARAFCAAAFLFLPDALWAFAAYFFVLGFFWMSTFPVVTALTSDLFGPQNLALKFGYAFLAHQVGGFAGTWLGGIIAQQTGSYATMFPVMCAGCLLAAGTTSFISRPKADAACR